MKINEIYSKDENITFDSYLNKCGVKDIDLYMERSYIEPLEHYDNIYNVARELLNSIKWGETIYLIVDCDCDGFMSASMSYIYIKKVNPNVEIVPIFHDKNPKAHGLEDDEIIKRLKTTEPSVLFITDAGSSDAKMCKKLKDLGWGIYIADHHKQNRDNPYCQIVNNQLSDNVTNKQLCGCGVTWKVLSAIDEINESHYAKDLISYVHFANVSDSREFVDAEQETFRYWGIKYLHSNLIPFINEFNEDLTNEGFSFGCISRMNALIRVGTLKDKEILFYALCGEYEPKVAIDKCKECKTTQDNQKKSLVNNVEIITDKNVVLAKIEQKTPLTGLMANILMTKYNKPILLLHDRENGEVSGSCRSTVPLQDILNNNELFNYAQGHLSSFGVSYNKDKEKDIIEYLDNELELPTPCIDVLGSYTTKSIPKYLWREFDHNDIYGKGIENPLIYLSFTYNPQNMDIYGKWGTTLYYIDSGVRFKWSFMSKIKKEELHLGFLDYNNLNSVGSPKFVENRENKKYKMNVVGTLDGNNTIIVKKWWLEDYQSKSIDDIF